MALERFWSAIQNARSLFFGRMNESVDGGHPADTSSLMDAARQTAYVWFTPDLVKDYDEADFTFLPDGDRTKLRQAVDEFRHLATRAEGDAPPPAQIEQGYNLFATINNLVAPHFSEEPELQRIAEATRSVPWPSYVFGVDCRVGTDSTGDPAVWLRFVLRDDVEIESPVVQAELDRTRSAYRAAIQKAGIDRWPYMTVRTLSEVKDRIGGWA